MISATIRRATSSALISSRSTIINRSSVAMSSSAASSSSASTIVRAPALTLSTLNPCVVAAQYAVRGELVMKADAYRDQLASSSGSSVSKAVESLPFSRIVACNIGNPHDLGQRPITFFREVLSLMHNPVLGQTPAGRALFASDALDRAAKYSATLQGGTGAYTSSQGMKIVRTEVAEYIERRDGGIKADADDIFLTDGASSGVKMLLQLLVRSPADGVMTPIPQYPLYSATLALLHGSCVDYYLDESAGWGLTRSELESSYDKSVAAGVAPRALVIINPGNPTGQSLPRDTMEEIVRFAEERGLALMADEVYQTNVYNPAIPFTSFKKVVRELNSNVALVSFHSVSKGFLGECGQRGGYFELVNLPAVVKEQLVKLTSISLCSNTSGQIMTGLMARPPMEGEVSYELYHQESTEILKSLARRAKMVADALNTCTNVRCNAVEGALYAFPSIVLPSSAILAAASAGKAPDVFYALALLDATGICVVPGSGFGQRQGTFHFRTTILPSEEVMDQVMKRFEQFNEQFMKKYC